LIFLCCASVSLLLSFYPSIQFSFLLLALGLLWFFARVLNWKTSLFVCVCVCVLLFQYQLHTTMCFPVGIDVATFHKSGYCVVLLSFPSPNSFWCFFLSFFFFFFCGAEDWTQGFMLAKQAQLEPCFQSILLWLFWRWGLMNYLPVLALNHIPPDLSLPSRITGVSHQCSALMFLIAL
jgi:hypothetical protein